MTMLFPLGYNGKLVTEEELWQSDMWNSLDAEFARRLLALMKAMGAMGYQYGVGGAARSTERQKALFLDRHTQVALGGCCSWDGKRWKLKAGVAHAAPPGRSYHEDDVTPVGKCLAADMIGDHAKAATIMSFYGLMTFASINNEPWHYQPWEIPTGRASWNPDTMWPLRIWPLPNQPIPSLEEDDMARIIRICEKDGDGNWQFTHPAQFVVTGGSMEWLTTKERRDAVISGGHAKMNPDTGQPYRFGRDQLKYYRLIGPLPPTEPGADYDPLLASEFMK